MKQDYAKFVVKYCNNIKKVEEDIELKNKFVLDENADVDGMEY